jgi:hypothetical protein
MLQNAKHLQHTLLSWHPPHWAHIFWEFLDIHFSGWWVGRGLRSQPMLRRLISSCGDTLRRLFTRPVWLPRWTGAQNCCCDENSYTANAGEHLEGNWLPFGHLTKKGAHVELVWISAVLIVKVIKLLNYTFTFQSSFIMLFLVWKL